VGHRKPRALRRGDLIGVAAPAGFIEEDRLRRGVAELEALGFAVRVAEGTAERRGFTAGSAAVRLAALEGLLANPDVRAIVCARGGAGVMHLMPHLDPESIRTQAKLVVGYSDVTLLHLLMARAGLTSAHGPMVARELAEGEQAYDRASLWHALTGDGRPYATGPDELVALRDGGAEGTLRGGCLSLLAAAAGTPWALTTEGEPTLLFIEDVDEKPFRIDRMLRQLRAAGAFAGVKGVVFGDMKGCAPPIDADYRLDDVLLEALAGLDVPVALGLSSGHAVGVNVTLPFGVRARLTCQGEDARLEVLEAPVA
jgi:muramoyltetrapeptide carboxypeptidase